MYCVHMFIVFICAYVSYIRIYVRMYDRICTVSIYAYMNNMYIYAYYYNSTYTRIYTNICINVAYYT